LSNAPTLHQMRSYFVNQVDALVQRLLADAFAKKLNTLLWDSVSKEVKLG
jgi:hypothetical protein